MEFLSGKRVLITGATGYLAGGILQRLQNVDCQIVRLSRTSFAGPVVSYSAGIEDRTGNLRDPSLWDTVLKDVEIIFHLAGQTSTVVAARDAAADLDGNVIPLLTILESCRRNAYRPAVIFAGTATQVGLTSTTPVNETVRDKPITMYDLHKNMAEQYLEFYSNLDLVCGVTLRLSNVYGPGGQSSSADRGVLNRMVRKAIDGEVLTVFGNGNYIRDFLFIDDAVNAFLAAARSIGQINGKHFFIGSGAGHSIRETVQLVSDRVALRTGRTAPVAFVAPPPGQSPIETRNFVADIRAFSDRTAWSPMVSLEAGIDRTIDYFLM